MAKQKKSFMEKLIGSKKEDEGLVLSGSEDMRMNVSSEETRQNIITSAVNENSADDDLSTDDWGENNEIVKDDGEGQLTIDVFQTDEHIVIKSTIAGVNPEDLDVSINSDMVTIKGDRKFEEEVEEENFYYQECYWGSFSRSVVLPVDVMADKAEASLKNGILTIKLPKADMNKTKKIKVRGF